MQNVQRTINDAPAQYRLLLRQSGRCWLFLCVVLSLLHLGGTQSAQAELVYSKSRRFRIPFQFNASELKRLGTKEVQLFSSRDGGGHWELAESVAPETSKFTFEAPEDGVYWFSVKTVSASGLIYPAGPHQPGLNVLVDSTPPKIQLELEQIEEGRVRLTWFTQDDHLDLSTLKLEFKEPGSAVWDIVAVRTQEKGQTSWTTSQAGEMKVRGEVADLVGNISHESVALQMTVPAPRNDRPDFTQPVASEMKEIPSITANGTLVPPMQAPRLTTAPSGGGLVVKETTDSRSTAAGHMNGAATTPQFQKNPRPDVSEIHHKMNSNAFRIGYSLDGVGPSGVKQVDLYITEDNGKKWFHYGRDPDRVSPIEVTVPRDGEYGLCFRVTNGLGRVDIPPQPNDPPELRITVDTQPPVAKLLPLEHGQGANLNQVTFNWTAQDNDLADQPIALFYSVNPTGPWEPIQSWQPNSGHFTWTVPSTLNQQFYVRLDVRDSAGNTAHVYSEKPFLIDRSRPRARVTEVESLNRSTR